MAIYDNLPYTNFHELNADWLLKQMKEAKAKIDEYQEVLDQFEEDYNVLLGLASAMTVAGSNVTVAGSLTANGLIGNLTGNVTGDVTGDLTGNADESDVTTDMYVTVNPSETRTDMNDYLPTIDNRFQIFETAVITSNYPGTLEAEKFIVLAFKTDLGALQIVFAPPATYSLYYRVRVGSTWQSWHSF